MSIAFVCFGVIFLLITASAIALSGDKKTTTQAQSCAQEGHKTKQHKQQLPR
jgi:hypothetical protein